MRFLLGLSTLLLVATTIGADALSCMRPDVARDYRAAAASADRYIIVTGDLSFAGKPLPPNSAGAFQARLRGQSLSDSGFKTPFDQTVDIEIRCLGPWCGRVTQGHHLAFVQQTQRGYRVVIEPCGGMLHVRPSQTDLTKVLNCHRGGPCRDAAPKR